MREVDVGGEDDEYLCIVITLGFIAEFERVYGLNSPNTHVWARIVR